MEEIKRCPYCDEEILSIAIKCKHCGEWLNDNEKSETLSSQHFQMDKKKDKNVTAENFAQISPLLRPSRPYKKWFLYACISIAVIVFLKMLITNFDKITKKTDVNIEENDTSVLPINSSENEIFTNLVEAWNQAHSLDNINQFYQLFDNTVLFYGSKLDKDEIITKKQSLLDKYTDFELVIVSDIEVDEYEPEQYKCSFIKRVTVSAKTTDYPSYLIFRKHENSWKIIAESDVITDINLAKSKGTKISEYVIKGDFNGDGDLEYAWLVPPKIKYDDMDCVGDCVCYIRFSDPKIPTIATKIDDYYCIGGFPDNLGDLNEDGADEIGLLPDWFTSCWRGYYVWTLKNNQWIYAVEPFETHCNQFEAGTFLIKKDSNKDGYAIIEYSEHTGDDIVTKRKSVPIK